MNGFQNPHHKGFLATKNHIRQDKTPSDSYVESYRVTVKAFPDG